MNNLEKLEYRIDQIMEELSSRTAWGVMLDLIELVELRTEAKHSITILNNAIIKINMFTDEYIPNPEIPKDDKE